MKLQITSRSHYFDFQYCCEKPESYFVPNSTQKQNVLYFTHTSAQRKKKSLILEVFDLSYLCNLVKFAKKFIQHVHEFTWRAVAGQSGETNDICIEDAAENKHKEHVTLVTFA